MNYFKSAMVNHNVNQVGVQNFTLNTGSTTSENALLLVSPMVLVTEPGTTEVEITSNGVIYATYVYADQPGYFRMPAVLIAASAVNAAHHVQVRVSINNSTFDGNCWLTASVVELEQADR